MPGLLVAIHFSFFLCLILSLLTLYNPPSALKLASRIHLHVDVLELCEIHTIYPASPSLLMPCSPVLLFSYCLKSYSKAIFASLSLSLSLSHTHPPTPASFSAAPPQQKLSFCPPPTLEGLLTPGSRVGGRETAAHSWLGWVVAGWWREGAEGESVLGPNFPGSRRGGAGLEFPMWGALRTFTQCPLWAAALHLIYSKALMRKLRLREHGCGSRNLKWVVPSQGTTLALQNP